jgi:hypothetical protein
VGCLHRAAPVLRGSAEAHRSEAPAISRPTLSVTGITWNSGNRLERWITRAREYADEVVLLVDESSTDDTYDIARDHADSVRLVEHPPYIEVYYDLALRHAQGDWILWLDDDEVMGRGLADTRDDLLSERSLTHYSLPYRWVVGDEAAPDGTARWLTTFPWHPNPRPRLIRNIPSIFWHRGRLHSPLEIAGDGRILAPDEAVVYHLDLAWRSRAEREAKVARYRGNNAPSCEEYYLYEDYAATLTSEPVPEPLEREALPAGLAAAARRSQRGRIEPTLPRALVAAEQARVRRFWDNAPLFSAEYAASTTPTEVLTNRGYAVEVTIRNTSPVPWRSSGPERGRISLGYHWLSPQHGVVLREGDRSTLAANVDPGATTTVQAGLWTPYEPGDYVLEWDLVSEGISWFSERGVAPLSVAVTVSAEDRLLAKPRAVATLPPPAAPTTEAAPARPRLGRVADRAKAVVRAGQAVPAPRISAGNVTPLRPVRVLDTRDGSGAPGSVTGPVAAGSLVTLRVGGTFGIPDYAAGVVATLSVPQADYNGFVNVLGGEGPPSGIVSGYFTDTAPVAFQVLTALVDGKLSIWLSDNFPGRAQLLLDVVAYLNP